MTRTLFRIAAVSALALAAAAGVSAAYAQAVSDRYDGYCYVRPADMQRNSYTDNRGVTHSSARCYQGEYYAYGNSYYAAPAAPQGYQVEYFSHRPAQTYYDHVYEASGASSTYGSNDDSYQGDDRYGGSDQYADQRRYSDSDRYGDSSDDQDRSSYGSSYADNGSYGQDNRYSPYGNSSYSHSGSDTSNYGNSSYGNSSYDSSDDSPDSNNASYDHGYKSHSALAGWRDDAGQWHVGRPRAIGWEDENGKWHEGQIAAYGWRDSRGGWHEDNSSSASTSYDNGYSDDSGYGRSHAYNGN